MANALLSENQKKYLSTLIHQYPANMNAVADVLADLNHQYRRKIQDGAETIVKRTQSLSVLMPHASGHTKEQLHKYAVERKQLQTKLKEIYPKLAKDNARSMVLSDQQRLSFIKKMQAQQEELQRIKEQHTRIRQFKIRQREEEERQEREQSLRQKQQMKRMEVERRLEELAELRDKREQELRERNREYQQVAHEKILLHRIQENYSKLQDINLQQKKKKLAQIREIHKPMSKQQFEQHLSHINQYRTLHVNIRRSEDTSKSLSPATHRFYKSHWYKEVISQEKIQEDSFKDEKKQLLKELKDRQKKYSEYIKHNFAPDPDEELVEERLKRKAPPIKRKKAKEIRTMGLLNLKASKEMKMSQEQLEAKRKSQANPQTPTKKTINYLQQLKKNRRSNSLNPSMFLKVTKSDAKDNVKAESVLNFAEKLEKKAEQRQKLQKVKKNILDSEVDELYMGALKAKLQLLNNK